MPIFLATYTHNIKNMMILMNKRATTAPYNPYPKKMAAIANTVSPNIFKAANKTYLPTSLLERTTVKKTVVKDSKIIIKERSFINTGENRKKLAAGPEYSIKNMANTRVAPKTITNEE